MSTATSQRATGAELAAYIAKAGIEFLDFGCSRGQSITQAQQMFGAGAGLGIDIDPSKLAAAREAGYDAVDFDILELPDEPLVRFVTMVHFLEHLNGYEHAKAMLRKACRVARDFVFLRQPYFDADGQLLALGLKLYWSDWRGHRFPMTTLALYRILRDLRNEGTCACFTIALYDRIRSSDHSSILPLEAPDDQHDYDAGRHPGKPAGKEFSFPVFREVRAVISTNESEHEKISARVNWHHELVGRDGRVRPI